jgi:hypothetical protein
VVAQSAPDALKPNPVSIIIQVVPWLLKDGHPTYFVTAQGHGRTTEEARTEALRAAVDQAVGSVISSQREVENRELRRSEVVQYASGYVDRYEVKSIKEHNGLVAVTVDVWVRRSRLQDRLLGKHETPGRVDTDRLVAQSETINHSRQQGDRLLEQVLRDYPRRAFDLEVGQSRVTYDDQRRQRIEISWKLRWRHAYLESLREALSAVSQNSNAGDCVGLYARTCQHMGYVTIKARPGRHGWSRTAGFDDSITLGMVRQHLIDSHPAILVTLTGRSGNQIWRGCYRYGELENIPEGLVPNDRITQPTHNGILVNGWMVVEGSAPFVMTPAMYGMDSAKMEIVRRSDCPN